MSFDVLIQGKLRGQLTKGIASNGTAFGRFKLGVTDKNGESRDYLDTMASTGKDETASTATLRVALEQFVNSRDEIDRMIIECKRDNYTEREIAEVVGINRAAVHKRIDKMREALRNIGLTPAEAVA